MRGGVSRGGWMQWGCDQDWKWLRVAESTRSKLDALHVWQVPGGRLFSFRDHTLCDRSEARSCHGVLASGQLRLAVTFRVLANLHFQAVIQLLFQWASPLALSRSHHNLLHDMALLGNVLGFSAIGLLSRFGQLGIQKRNLFESELWDHSPSRTSH